MSNSHKIRRLTILPGFRNFTFYTCGGAILIFEFVRGLQAAVGIEVLFLLFLYVFAIPFLLKPHELVNGTNNLNGLDKVIL